MKDLVLTGFMGTGKSTVGRILARRYCLELVDLDEEIERRAGCSIAEYWGRHEEPAFRDLEHEVWRDVLAAGEGRVIATGGGTLVPERNRALLGGRPVICLTCAIEPLLERLGAQQSMRPALAGLDSQQVRENAERRLTDRALAYGLFHQVDTTDRTPEEVAAQIAQRHALSGFEYRFGPDRITRVEFVESMNEEISTALDACGLTGAAVVVTDQIVAEKVLKSVAHPWLVNLGRLQEAPARQTAVLPAGEEHKTLEAASVIFRTCQTNLADRSSCIVGIGGGVICDLAGFAAAIYMRGIRLVLVPTTLLAQADAAIGGKTAVDFDGVKNLIGAFHPAEVIVVCPEVLATLGDAHLADGLTEIIKAATVRCARLLEQVEQLATPRDVLAKPYIIRRAAELKARVVEADPYEQDRNGGRAMLNFGHTVGHSIEAAAGYRLSHGQAISIGMLAETRLAERLGVAPPGLHDRLADVLERFGQPETAPQLDADAVFAKMQQDKKRQGATIRMALPTGLGQGTVVEVGEEDARAAVAMVLGKENG